MDYTVAYKITNSKYSISILSNDWKIEKADNKIILSSLLADSIVFLSYEKFVKDYICNFKISLSGEIKGEYILSSIGLITQEQYNLAEDMMTEYIDSSELRNGYQYLSSNGKKYIYIDNIKIKYLFFNTIDLFFSKVEDISKYLIEVDDDKYNVIKYRSDIKLISKIDKFEGIEDITDIILSNSKDYYTKDSSFILMSKSIKKSYLVKKTFNSLKYLSNHICHDAENDFYFRVPSVSSEVEFKRVCSYNFVNYNFYAKKINKFKLFRELHRFMKSDMMSFDLKYSCLSDEFYFIDEDSIPF